MDTKTRILKAINFFNQFGGEIWGKDLFRERWFPTFIRLVKEYINAPEDKQDESYENVQQVFGEDKNQENF